MILVKKEKKWDQWQDHHKPRVDLFVSQTSPGFKQQNTRVSGWGLWNGRGRLATQNSRVPISACTQTPEVGRRSSRGQGAGGQPASEAPPSPAPRRGAVGVGSVSSHFWEVALTSCSSPQNLEIRLHFPNSQPGHVTSSAEKGGLRETSVPKGTHVAISLTT